VVAKAPDVVSAPPIVRALLPNNVPFGMDNDPPLTLIVGLEEDPCKIIEFANPLDMENALFDI
jgi:hypothetical protein